MDSKWGERDPLFVKQLTTRSTNAGFAIQCAEQAICPPSTNLSCVALAEW